MPARSMIRQQRRVTQKVGLATAGLTLRGGSKSLRSAPTPATCMGLPSRTMKLHHDLGAHVQPSLSSLSSALILTTNWHGPC
jgi:hypothetical protein